MRRKGTNTPAPHTTEEIPPHDGESIAATRDARRGTGSPAARGELAGRRRKGGEQKRNESGEKGEGLARRGGQGGSERRDNDGGGRGGGNDGGSGDGRGGGNGGGLAAWMMAAGAATRHKRAINAAMINIGLLEAAMATRRVWERGGPQRALRLGAAAGGGKWMRELIDATTEVWRWLHGTRRAGQRVAEADAHEQRPATESKRRRGMMQGHTKTGTPEGKRQRTWMIRVGINGEANEVEAPKIQGYIEIAKATGEALGRWGGVETDPRLRYMWRRGRGPWKSAATGEMIPNGTEVMIVPKLEAAAESRRESEEDTEAEKGMETAGTDGEEGEDDPFSLEEAMEEERKRRGEGRRDDRREHGTQPGRSGEKEAGGEGSEEAGTTGREGDREDEEEGSTGEGNDGAERQYEEQKLEQVREDMTNILEEEVWPEEQSSANEKREWTGRRLRAALYTRHGHKAGEHYEKRWLSNRAATYMSLRRMLDRQKEDATADEDGEGATARTGTDRTGGAAEDNEGTERDDDPWWPSDLVKVLQAAEGGAGRRK